MNLDFLILSTPRSGSAWLANFLTTGPVFCYHDPGAGGPLSRLERQAPITGAIDTGVWMFKHELPRVKLLLALDRRPREVVQSCRDAGLSTAIDFELFRDLTSDLHTFRFEKLFDVGYLRDLWTVIAGPAEFNVERARQLIETNVQRDLEAQAALVRRTYAGER